MSTASTPWMSPGAAHRFVAAAVAFGGCAGDEETAPPTPITETLRIEYPIELWERGVEGETVLKVLVERDGGVDSVVVAESSGRAELDSAAVRGAREARFEAARGDGGPVRVWTRLPVRFARSSEPPETPPDSNARMPW